MGRVVFWAELSCSDLHPIRFGVLGILQITLITSELAVPVWVLYLTFEYNIKDM